MAEYIVEKHQTSGGWTWAEPKGELIRCRECKYVIPQGEYGSWYTCDMWHGQQIHTSLMGYCNKAVRKEE